MVEKKIGLTPRDLAVLAISAVVMSTVGVVAVFSYWASHGDYAKGVANAIWFAVFMLLTHVLSGVFLHYRAIVKHARESLTDSPTRPPYFDIVLAQQVPLAMLAALALDGGQMVRYALGGLVGHWTLIALVERRKTWTAIDASLVRWGYIPLCFLACLEAKLIWPWMGR